MTVVYILAILDSHNISKIITYFRDNHQLGFSYTSNLLENYILCLGWIELVPNLTKNTASVNIEFQKKIYKNNFILTNVIRLSF